MWSGSEHYFWRCIPVPRCKCEWSSVICLLRLKADGRHLTKGWRWKCGFRFRIGVAKLESRIEGRRNFLDFLHAGPDLFLNIRHQLLTPSRNLTIQLASLAHDFRQALRAEDNQRHYCNDRQFRNTDVEHGFSISGGGRMSAGSKSADVSCHSLTHLFTRR